VNEDAARRVDSPTVSEAQEEHAPLLGGGLLSARIRGDEGAFQPTPVSAAQSNSEQITLGAAAQIEIESGQVRFLIPFVGRWPSEHWLSGFRPALQAWPQHLVEPLLDEGRGLQLGPLPATELDEHVRAVKDLVATANRIYVEQIEPELRRQRDEAIRREQEEHRLHAEVEAKLKYLLG